MVSPPPPFLDGTFQWSRRGYFYASPPPENLLTREAQLSSDPWIALAARLEAAKAGEFSAVRDLPARSAAEKTSRLFSYGCMSLFGDAARDADLELLIPMLQQGSSEDVYDACWAAYCSGSARLLPTVFANIRRIRSVGDRESACYWVSDLLEEDDDGPLRNAFDVDLEEWLPLAERTMADVSTALGSDDVAVWRGRPFTVKTLVEEMLRYLERIDEEPGAAGLFTSLRHRFEAATGVDCTEFFVDGRFQPLAAAAILEEFVEQDGETLRMAGRSFFGNPIP